MLRHFVSNVAGQKLHYDGATNQLGFPGTVFLGSWFEGSSTNWEVKTSAGQAGEVYLSTVSGSTWGAEI